MTYPTRQQIARPLRKGDNVRVIDAENYVGIRVGDEGPVEASWPDQKTPAIWFMGRYMNASRFELALPADQGHTIDERAAAAYAWANLREIRWDMSRDDAEDVDLYRRVLETGRERWPWLDAAADDALALAGVEEPEPPPVVGHDVAPEDPPWADGLSPLHLDAYLESERFVAGAISTLPPFDHFHPQWALPHARQALAALSEWEPSDSAPQQENDAATEPEICGTCGGEGCEYGCGLSGGCEHAYAGPDSHRICRTCHGSGTLEPVSPPPEPAPEPCECSTWDERVACAADCQWASPSEPPYPGFEHEHRPAASPPPSADPPPDAKAKPNIGEPIVNMGGPRCDHICLLDDGHVERGIGHQYGYELPSPRAAAAPPPSATPSDDGYVLIEVSLRDARFLAASYAKSTGALGRVGAAVRSALDPQPEGGK